jgi:hypothetical protein
MFFSAPKRFSQATNIELGLFALDSKPKEKNGSCKSPQVFTKLFVPDYVGQVVQHRVRATEKDARGSIGCVSTPDAGGTLQPSLYHRLRFHLEFIKGEP